MSKAKPSAQIIGSPTCSESSGFSARIPAAETKSEEQRIRYSTFFTDAECTYCSGSRLRPESSAVLIGEKVMTEEEGFWVAQAVDQVKRALEVFKNGFRDELPRDEMLRQRSHHRFVYYCVESIRKLINSCPARA